MTNIDYIIGIDPDCEKSGVAVLSVKTRRIDLYSMPFPVLIDFFVDANERLENCLVLVEAGWMNQSNWHLHPKDSKAKAAAKGNAVGRNHETGRKIYEMARHYKIKILPVKPLRKCWKAKDGKISHDEIVHFIPSFPQRSNQETRDAALIAWNYAGFPIKIKPNIKQIKSKIS